MEPGADATPHVLIFPLPLQGHITPMLHLAELLCLANLKVTFLNTAQNHQRLTQHTNTEAYFLRYTRFQFQVIPEGLPDLHAQTGGSDLADLMESMVQGLATTFEPVLKEVIYMFGSPNTAPVTCLIVDGWLTFAYDVAREAGIPAIAFRCPSACCIWSYFCTPMLVEAGEVPFKDDEDMDRLVQNVPGMEKFLRCRDLPSFCRTKDAASCQGLQKMFSAERQRTEQGFALILNTLEDLEGPILSHIRTCCPRTYSIGPLHAQLKYRLLSRQQETPVTNNSSSSLWEEDKSCISWLDQKPDKSVIYVSFGSITTLKREQLIEIWAGLVQSKKYFLWVVRSNMIMGSKQDDMSSPDEVLEAGTKDRGCIVGWAPQEEVLRHIAVGGFLTHSGWNSTQESIIAGVPMLCWPYLADQQVNSRFVSEVWKIGLDMKDTCDRNIVEKMVSDLMDRKKDELERSIAKMSDLAKKSIADGGSSYCNLDRLIQDIKMMSRKELQ